MEAIGSFGYQEIEKLKIYFSSIGFINEDASNLDEVGMYNLKKFIKGKNKRKWSKSSGMMVHYAEKHQSVGAARVNKPDDKKKVWNQVKEEFYKLICTKDKKYTKVRKKLFSGIKQLCSTIVIMVAAAIAKSIGVLVGVISGSIAALFFAASAIGLSTYCSISGKHKNLQDTDNTNV